MSSGHDHHDHDHGHRPEPPSDVEARALALESLLIEKGILTSEQVDGIIRTFEQDIGPMLGARVVARAWVDPDFRRRLIEDANAAVGERSPKPLGETEVPPEPATGDWRLLRRLPKAFLRMVRREDLKTRLATQSWEICSSRSVSKTQNER